MLNLRNILEVHCVRYLEALHSICVTPFLEMLFKSSATPVASPTANFAFEFYTKTVKFIEPIRNGLSIPTHG
jgi:hypothetical protein